MAKTKPTPGERIKALRVEQGLTLAELASECGLSPTTLSQVERGLRISPRVAIVLSRYFGLELDELYNQPVEAA